MTPSPQSRVRALKLRRQLSKAFGRVPPDRDVAPRARLHEKIAHDAAHYWRLVFRWGERQLESAEDQVTEEWPVFLTASAISGLAVALLVRGAHMLGDLSGTTAIATLSLIPGIAISALALAVLIWSVLNFRQLRRDRAYALAFLASAIAILVPVESAAGITTYLLGSTRQAHATTSLDLWTAENFYLWQLADLIPFLHPEQTLGWTKPTGVEGFIPGLTVLILRILLVLPLSQLLLTGFWWIRGKLLNQDRSTGTSFDDFGSARVDMPRIKREFAIVAAVSPIISFVALIFFWVPNSNFHQLLVQHVPDQLQLPISGIGIDRKTLEETVRLVTVGGWIWLFGGLSLSQMGYILYYFRQISKRFLVGIIVFVILSMGQAVVLAASATYTVLRLDWGKATPALSANAPIPALISTQIWGLANDIPGLEVSKTLSWAAPHIVSGFLPGILTLSLKIFFIMGVMTLLFLPGAYRRSRERVDGTGQISAIGKFVNDACELEHLLNQANSDRGTKKQGRSSYRAAKQLLKNLDNGGVHVVMLFGPGQVSALAEELIQAAAKRFDDAFLKSRASDKRKISHVTYAARASVVNSILAAQKTVLDEFGLDVEETQKVKTFGDIHGNAPLSKWISEFVRVANQALDEAIPQGGHSS